jgi:trehalose-phosphatase
MQLELPEIELLSDLSEGSNELAGFLRSLAAAHESMLLLDFDGTLAPFRVDPASVRPWAGVTNLLEDIQSSGRTRMAIVSGRPAQEVSRLIDLPKPVEIWGLHGAERLFPEGELEQDELLPRQLEALARVREKVHDTRLSPDLRIEVKRNSVAFHWRGHSMQSISSARQRADDLLSPFAEVAGMQLTQFDGGIELRAGRNKGDAVRTMMEELGPNAPIAYLGDDITDEDAFQAVARLDVEMRGLGVLVRRKWRPTAARAWLRPPGQLRNFLAAWGQMVQR